MAGIAFRPKKCNKGGGGGRPDFMPKMSHTAKLQSNSDYCRHGQGHGWRRRQLHLGTNLVNIKSGTEVRTNIRAGVGRVTK